MVTPRWPIWAGFFGLLLKRYHGITSIYLTTVGKIPWYVFGFSKPGSQYNSSCGHPCYRSICSILLCLTLFQAVVENDFVEYSYGPIHKSPPLVAHFSSENAYEDEGNLALYKAHAAFWAFPLWLSILGPWNCRWAMSSTGTLQKTIQQMAGKSHGKSMNIQHLQIIPEKNQGFIRVRWIPNFDPFPCLPSSPAPSQPPLVQRRPLDCSHSRSRSPW